MYLVWGGKGWMEGRGRVGFEEVGVCVVFGDVGGRGRVEEKVGRCGGKVVM